MVYHKLTISKNVKIVDLDLTKKKYNVIFLAQTLVPNEHFFSLLESSKQEEEAG